MSGELFGGPAGSRLAEQDQQAAVLHSLAAAKAPFEIEHLQQQSRHLSALSDKESFALSNEKQMQAMLQAFYGQRAGGGAGGPPPPQGGAAGPAPAQDPLELIGGKAQEMFRLADMATSIGRLDVGRKLAGTASQMFGRVELAKEHQAQTELKAFELQSKQIDSAVRSLRGIKSQDDFDKAKMGWMMNHPGQEPPGFFERPFSEELINNMVESTISEKDRRTAAFREGQETRRSKMVENQEKYRNAELAIRNAQLGLTKRSLDMREKFHGDLGKGDKAPDKNERLVAKAAIKSLYPDLKEAEELDIAAELIAMDAKALIRSNPGWTMATALSKAAADRASDFKNESGLFGFSKSTKFKGTARPSAGAIVGGFEFLGGDPNSKDSWKAVDTEDDSEED